MADCHNNRLLVEDTDIQGVVVALMRNFLQQPWGTNESEWPVFVDGKSGKTKILDQETLKTELRGSALKRLGIVVDANGNAGSTWDRIRDLCRQLGGKAPQNCPKDGFVTTIGKVRYGAWIMPDNSSAGMVENLCHELVPDPNSGLWKYGKTASGDAKVNHGAPYKHPIHLDKAHIRSWLAWQDEPGMQMGVAISSGLLKFDHPKTRAFAKWFGNLFEIPLKAEYQ